MEKIKIYSTKNYFAEYASSLVQEHIDKAKLPIEVQLCSEVKEILASGVKKIPTLTYNGSFYPLYLEKNQIDCLNDIIHNVLQQNQFGSYPRISFISTDYYKDCNRMEQLLRWSAQLQLVLEVWCISSDSESAEEKRALYGAFIHKSRPSVWEMSLDQTFAFARSCSTSIEDAIFSLLEKKTRQYICVSEYQLPLLIHQRMVDNKKRFDNVYVLFDDDSMTSPRIEALRNYLPNFKSTSFYRKAS